MNKITTYLSNAVKNYALRQWKLYSFKNEWLAVIILVIAVKIATSAVSIFSGFYYLDNLFYSLFDSDFLSKSFTVISLILIECLNALFLAKFFKFLLRFNNLKFVFPLLFSAGLFVLSFIISCNGIAIYTSDKVDISKTIENKYITQINAVKKECNEQIKMFNEKITNIKSNPAEWKNGQRCILSKEQLNDINESYNQIADCQKNRDSKIKELLESKKIELTENTTNTETESSKYYRYVSVIMIVQFICSFALSFFWCRISGEEDEKTNQKECVERGLKMIENTVDNCIDSRIATKLNILQTIYREIATENDNKKTLIAAQTETHKTASEQKKVVGFEPLKIHKNTESEQQPQTPETAQNNAVTGGVSDVNDVILTPSKNALSVKKCLLCNKELTANQNARNAKFCSVNCRVKYYNLTHPERKKITIKDESLKH